jgi:hypothetical protein
LRYQRYLTAKRDRAVDGVKNIGNQAVEKWNGLTPGAKKVAKVTGAIITAIVAGNQIGGGPPPAQE